MRIIIMIKYGNVLYEKGTVESGDVLIVINETAVFLSEPRRQPTIESDSVNNGTYPFFVLSLFISTDVHQLALSTTYIKIYFH